jgi:hypothetical protein
MQKIVAKIINDSHKWQIVASSQIYWLQKPNFLLGFVVENIMHCSLTSIVLEYLMGNMLLVGNNLMTTPLIMHINGAHIT